MKNRYVKIGLLVLGTTITSQVSAQVKIGDNPKNINLNAALEIESANKGLILPRVALTSTTSVVPMTAHIEGMTVYNTATTGTGTTAVIPGYYYNDGTQWVRLTSDADIKTEPWYNQATNTEATENTQNIYQMGKVAIGRDETVAGARLDVAGNVTVGEGNTFFNNIEGLNSLAVGMDNHVGVRGLVIGNDNTVTGASSFAVGSENEVRGPNSVAMGSGSSATGTNSIAIGSFATASAANSVVLGGNNNTSSGLNAFSGGSSSVANGNNAIAFGLNVTASSFAEIVLGKYNAITNGTISSAVNTDPLFQIGNGLNDVSRGNALTILKNGNVGIANEAIAPTERIDVGSGNIRVRNINTNTGLAIDKVVVADADGVLKTVKATMPRFFYMPSIIVPTSLAQLDAPGSGKTAGDSFNNATGQGTIDLHARYTAQFGTPMVKNLTQTTTLPTIGATQLDYNITWYDINVFSAVAVSDTGIMTYTLAPGADVTVGSFMNIVFSVK